MSGGGIDTPSDRTARAEAAGEDPVGTIEVVVASADDGSGLIRSRRGRRDGANTPNAMIASAARLNLNDRRAVETTRHRRQAWQSESWDYYDEVGEIGYTIGFLANLMSKLRLFPAVRPQPDSAPVPVDADDAHLPPEVAQLAVETLARLRSGQGGQSAIVREMSMNFEVAGECYLHGHEELPEFDEADQPDPTAPPEMGPDGKPAEREVNLEAVEDWQIRSVDELTVQNDVFVLRRGPGNNQGTAIPKTDLVIRLWERHPRFSEMATCAMRRVLGEAEALLLLSREIRATSKSRLSNGILLIPSELSFGGADPTRDQGDGEETDDPFDRELAQAMMTPIQEEGSAAAVVPIILRGPADVLQHVNHLALDKSLDPVLDQRIEQRILRIARGLNMPVEVTTGMMATTYANAVQIKQSEFEDHIEPRAVMLCDAVTSGYFQWALEQAGVDPTVARTIFCWYDASALVIKPDQSEQAASAHMDGVISDAARRKYQGFTEDDAPPDDEILRRLLLKGGRMDPFIEANLFRLTRLAVDMPIPAPAAGILGEERSVSAMPAPGADPGAPEPPAPGQPPTAVPPGKPTAELAPAPKAKPEDKATAAPVSASGARQAEWSVAGPRLSAVDRELRGRITGALDQALRTALDRAGNRIKSRVQRASGGATDTARAAVEGVPANRVAATLGQPVVAAAGISDDELMNGSFESVLDDTARWMTAAADRVEAILVRAAGRPIPEVEARTRELAVAQHISDAREWLQENLQAFAIERLYQPTAGSPPEGEHDDTILIPIGLVRAAICVAGGGKPDGGSIVAGAWASLTGPLTDMGGNPVGGIGTGSDASDIIGAFGAQREAWRWEYGGAARNPFQPHLDLDQSIVSSTSDKAWANADPFPLSTQYFPGDHVGCNCDLSPILVADDGSSTIQTIADLFSDGGDTSAAADSSGGYTLSERDPAAYADELGYTREPGDPSEADVAAARAELADVRQAVRDEAAQIADQHEAFLESAGLDRGSIALPGPSDSWYQTLSAKERSRMWSAGWWAPAGSQTAISSDEFGQAMTVALGMGDAPSDAGIQAWVQETRIIDAARALANGRVVIPARYGGLDANALVDSPYDLESLFANRTTAAQHLAEVNSRYTAEEADRILGPTVGGPAPWTMSEAQYVAEVTQVETAVQGIVPIADDEWTGPVYSQADQATLDRYRTLVPDALDDPANPVAFTDIYRDILKLARGGGLI